MPPRLLLVPVRVGSRQLEKNVCPSCQFSNLVRQYRVRDHAAPRFLRPNRRHASSLSSTTAVNATKDIPVELKDLYTAVTRLRRDAPNYVNIGRLQLALRNLESRHPVVRIAVLGLQSNGAVRRLARLLLADVLSDEGAWERQLDSIGDDDPRSFILRYGNEDDLPPPNALVTTIHIPSPILETFNLEILVSTLNADTAPGGGENGYEQLRTTALVPVATTPASFGEQVSFVRYPVHRALVLAEGLDGALALGRLSAASAESEAAGDEAVKVALQLPALASEYATNKSSTLITVLDLAKAAEGLALFRQSNANGIAYERAWYASGLPTLTEWAFPKDPSFARSAVLRLIESLLDETSQSILLEDTEHLQHLTSTRINTPLSQPLQEATSAWATASHTELQANLEKAFISEPWRKLKWWKLFWRVDDVGMLLNEILERSWLVDAEKGVIFLAGRGAEAGIYTEAPAAAPVTDSLLLGERDTAIEPVKTTSTDPDEALAVAAAAEAAQPTAVTPWPKTIPLARQHLNLTSIPPLQALAQSLLVQTLSLTSSATALSALLYLSLPTVSVFEAGAVAALGLVYSLRRMQKRWENARGEWQLTLRERGRIVLRGTEDGIKTALERGPSAAASTGQSEDVGVQDRRAAREAVQRAREALEAVNSADGSSKK